MDNKKKAADAIGRMLTNALNIVNDAEKFKNLNGLGLSKDQKAEVRKQFDAQGYDKIFDQLAQAKQQLNDRIKIVSNDTDKTQ